MKLTQAEYQPCNLAFRARRPDPGAGESWLGIKIEGRMDIAKCKALKAALSSESEPQIVAVDRFFDGNDDLGSIGCNLFEHPGIDTFRDTLVGLLSRPDVEAVYALIYELDPGEDAWPFADTVLVFGDISRVDLERATTNLQPDEVAAPEPYGIPESITSRHRSPAQVIWWD